ncbi:hypothetical protein M758_6G175800 [Ceratodon purpureus]|uniref:BTB/POZ domain-containing protein n=1 Tax=Ceratodon purpureus TaxID=3225 RepID=A0A8T0HHL0_CERPU|nr:hypothetical protein KC19_6G182900 [Ceratodon purpureus]KAG0614425.1 hypothetical protein M758_6G175800 [Ceratodon purpureus]
MSSQAATEEGGPSNTSHVTIYLVPPNSATELGSVTRKRSRPSLEAGVQTPLLSPLGEIQADASKLRACSKYFDACMSGRWTAGQTQSEFYLEVQTDVHFYHDCFACMDHLVTGMRIESVADCIQLLKVASQIQYDLVIDIGVRYLAGVPWNEDEENQIREFYASGQLASDSSTDLRKRLQLPLNEEERQQSRLNLTERILRRSLQLCSTGTNSKSRKESRMLFRETFEAIVRASGPGKCNKLLQLALTMVYQESERLLTAIKKTCQERLPHASLHTKLVSKFCWLFDTLWMSSSTQAVVELVLRDQEIPRLLQTKLHFLAQLGMENRWASMMRKIFEDVLLGRLFLKTSERLALFRRWVWILKDGNFDPETPPCANLVCSFILTFPQEEQEMIFCRWLSSLDDPMQHSVYDLSEAHSLWMKHLVAKSTDGDSDPLKLNQQDLLSTWAR